MADYLKEKVKYAKDTAEAAGKILISHFGEKKQTMKSFREVVTQADTASEEFILDAISREYGEPVLSEEFNPKTPISDSLWIIDPLDGTNNFAVGFPFFCVIIAFAENHDIKIGIVHDPLRKETFWSDGSASYLGDAKISVGKTRKLSDCLAATGFPYNRRFGGETNLENFVRITMAVRGIRRTGSAGLDLAYTAAGRLDFYWELDLKPWDMAAGELLVRCAGGKTGLFDGSKWALGDDRILAANPEIFDKATKLLKNGG